MKKSVLTFVFILLVLTIGVYAAQNTTNSSSNTNSASTDSVSKAYQCLENSLNASKRLSLQESIFSVMALGARAGPSDVIQDEKKTPEGCWPKTSCTIKETAQAILALDRTGATSEESIKWLLTKNKSAQELTWYLQLDINQKKASQCKLKYSGNSYNLNVKEDMTLEGSPGSCFDISPSGYWLTIRKSCYSREFEISCNEDFISSLLFERSGTGTIFVVPNTHSAAALGTTTESVDAQCFGLATNQCDYEGTLWAAVALQKKGKEVSQYVPYLAALVDEQQKYMPNAFVYLISGMNDQYSKVLQSQKQEKFWQAPSTPYNRFYDSAVALLAVGSSGASEAERAREYFLSIQTKEGCWNNNNIRDTAFLLYSGWPRAVTIPSNGGGTTPASCTSSGYYCGQRMECLETGGLVYDNYLCSGLNVCCSKQIEKTCTEQRGNICNANQECAGQTTPASDGTCCLGACQNRAEETTECEDNFGACSVSCGDNEEEADFSCGESSSRKCCLPKQDSFPWVWIIILLVIIALVALGIVYRDKVNVWWLSLKGKIQSSKVQPGAQMRGPGLAVPPGRQGFIPQGMPSKASFTAPRRIPSSKDREMDETLKKLREIGEG